MKTEGNARKIEYNGRRERTSSRRCALTWRGWGERNTTGRKRRFSDMHPLPNEWVTYMQLTISRVEFCCSRIWRQTRPVRPIEVKPCQCYCTAEPTDRYMPSTAQLYHLGDVNKIYESFLSVSSRKAPVRISVHICVTSVKFNIEYVLRRVVFQALIEPL